METVNEKEVAQIIQLAQNNMPIIKQDGVSLYYG